MEVIIRPLQEQDAYTSVNWRNDPEVFKYTGTIYQNKITIDTELDWLRKVANNPKDYRCAILADGVYVGNIYLTNIDEKSAHYHIFIGNKDYWGKGIAKQASIQIINYGFKVLGVKTIYLRVRLLNERAILLYENLGFKKIDADEEWATMAITQSDC